MIIKAENTYTEKPIKRYIICFIFFRSSVYIDPYP